MADETRRSAQEPQGEPHVHQRPGGQVRVEHGDLVDFEHIHGESCGHESVQHEGHWDER